MQYFHSFSPHFLIWFEGEQPPKNTPRRSRQAEWGNRVVTFLEYPLPGFLRGIFPNYRWIVRSEAIYLQTHIKTEW